MKAGLWREDNRVRLLENGEEYFPRVFASIGAATEEVLIEVFILFEDRVGNELHARLIDAARRGVRVRLVVDGYGSANLTAPFIEALTAAGVVFRMFDPSPRVLGIRTGVFRRLHRKLVVVDRDLAFIGGINFSREHLREDGQMSKQDYAVEVDGPVVNDIRDLMLNDSERQGRRRPRWWHWWVPTPSTILTRAQRGTARAMLAMRDNDRHRQDIERIYRAGIRSAQREIVIANAYFLPSYRLLRELRNASQRGVAVHLILQGRPDLRLVSWVEAQLHGYLLEGGVRIHEYCERPLHGKVAVVDDEWSTVGSSNLDPLSLALNLEANLVIHDLSFTAQLRRSLKRLIQEECREITYDPTQHGMLLRRLFGFMIFHVLRRVPVLAGWLPAHTGRRRTGPAVTRTQELGLHRDVGS